MEFVIDGYTVIVDDEDAHLLGGDGWHAVEPTPGKVYIRWRSRKGGDDVQIYLHRAITNAPKGVLVDHRDGDSLNCRRANLRLGDSLLNSRNKSKARNATTTSRFKGVCWSKRYGKWVAQITYDASRRHLGYFDNEVHAALAYDVASIKFHGDQGRTNILPLVR